MEGGRSIIFDARLDYVQSSYEYAVYVQSFALMK